MTERLVDVGTVARLLSMSTQRIRDWIKEGKLRATRLPSGRFKIPVSEVHRIRNGQISEMNH